MLINISVLSLPDWFPGAFFRRKAIVSKDCATQMIAEPFEYATTREVNFALTHVRNRLMKGRPRVAVHRWWHLIF